MTRATTTEAEHQQLEIGSTVDPLWIVEVKRDDDITSEEVQAKRIAAQRWVNHVNADDAVTVPWRYLLLSETDIRQATGSWPALKSLGT